MKKIEKWLERWLVPIGQKLNGNKYLSILKHSMASLIPITIAGSIALIITNFPFIDNVLPATFLEEMRAVLAPINGITINLISIYLIIAIAYHYAKEFEMEFHYTISIAMAAFLILIPFEKATESGELLSKVIPVEYLGSSGMFVAIFCTFFSCWLFRKISSTKLTIKMPESVPPNVIDAFSALVPFFVVLIVMIAIRFVFSLTPFNDVNTFVYSVIQLPLTNIGTGFIPTVLIGILVQLFWFMGLHGQSLVGSVMHPIWIAARNANNAAFLAGKELPYIVTEEFVAEFMWPSFIGLVITLVIFSKKGTANRAVGNAAIGAAAFKISEPVVFGLPIVMNVLTLIPWVLVMAVNATVSYGAMYIGLVPRPTGVTIPWTTPPIISGYLVTNSIGGSLLQIVNIAIGVLIWVPFIKALSNQTAAEIEDSEIVESNDNSIETIN